MSYYDDGYGGGGYGGGGYGGGGYGGGGYGGGGGGYGGGGGGYGGGGGRYGGGGGGYGGGGGGYGGGSGGYGGGGGGDRYGGGGGGRDRFGGGGGGYGGGRGGGGRGGGGGGGRGRGGGGRGGGGRGRGDRGGGRGRGDRGRGGGGFRRGGGDGGPPNKRFRSEDDDNWEEADRHSLMQSLFMESEPENFETQWLFVVCPPGKRRVLVGANDITQSYNNAGAKDLRFKSCLPSGSDKANEVHKYDDLTILDTVYSPEKKRFYIVDMLHWKHYPYYDTEAEFRFFCLPDKYSELTTPQEVTESNEYPLEMLQKFPCSQANIEKAIQAVDYKVEGLLFIEKNSTYVCHDSSDCLWLKLDQMEKVLGFPVPEGVNFAATNSKDEKRKQEQEDRKKLRAEREAAKERQELEKQQQEEAKAAAEGEGEGDGTEATGEYWGNGGEVAA